MLWALVEGAAGIRDILKGFKNIRLSPRWESVGIKYAEVKVEYPSSGAWTTCKYECSADTINLEITGSPEEIEIELMLPAGADKVSASVSGAVITDTGRLMNGGKYFGCRIMKSQLQCTFTLQFKT